MEGWVKVAVVTAAETAAAKAAEVKAGAVMVGAVMVVAGKAAVAMGVGAMEAVVRVVEVRVAMAMVVEVTAGVVTAAAGKAVAEAVKIGEMAVEEGRENNYGAVIDELTLVLNKMEARRSWPGVKAAKDAEVMEMKVERERPGVKAAMDKVVTAKDAKVTEMKVERERAAVAKGLKVNLDMNWNNMKEEFERGLKKEDKEAKNRDAVLIDAVTAAGKAPEEATTRPGFWKTFRSAFKATKKFEKAGQVAAEARGAVLRRDGLQTVRVRVGGGGSIKKRRTTKKRRPTKRRKTKNHRRPIKRRPTKRR